MAFNLYVFTDYSGAKLIKKLFCIKRISKCLKRWHQVTQALSYQWRKIRKTSKVFGANCPSRCFWSGKVQKTRPIWLSGTWKATVQSITISSWACGSNLSLAENLLTAPYCRLANMNFSSVIEVDNLHIERLARESKRVHQLLPPTADGSNHVQNLI